MHEPKDQIYRDQVRVPQKFRFDHKVAAVFENMIYISVSGYQQILEMLPNLVRHEQTLRGNYYDLGCSLKAGMLAVTGGLNAGPRTIIGFDNSPAMQQQAKKNLAIKK